MDLTMTLLGVIFLAICTVPLVVSYKKKKNKEHKLFNALNSLAKDTNCTITSHEFCRNFVIGIDQERHFLFFDNLKKEGEEIQSINLAEIKSCKLDKKMRESSSYTVIQEISLVFTPKVNSGEIRLEMYNDDQNMQLADELQIAEKWVKIINEHL